MKNALFCLVAALTILGWHPCAEASVFITEILADPAAGLAGDANADGVRSGSDDEFVEIFNQGSTAIDLTGWYLTDAASTRHLFPASTVLLPDEYLVVFGGGAPALSGVFTQTASSGTLSLNNGGDTITLWDADDNPVNVADYGSIGGNDQSVARLPNEATAGFVLYTSLEGADGRLFSPGEGNGTAGQNGQAQADVPGSEPAVPEPSTLAMMAFGGLAALRKK